MKQIKIKSIEGNHQWLDGGAMFGNAPKNLWSKWVKPDEFNRIELATRGFLVESDQKFLIEAGIGNFFKEPLLSRFGVFPDEPILFEALKETKLDGVILSHLHFDHAGGLVSKEGKFFFDCPIYVSKNALDRSLNPGPREKASFPEEMLNAIKNYLRVLDINFPFEYFETNGHTIGHLHTVIQGRTNKAVFCGDLIPGVLWLKPQITMGYDRFAEKVVEEKMEFFQRLNLGDYLLFEHDLEVSIARVIRLDPIEVENAGKEIEL